MLIEFIDYFQVRSQSAVIFNTFKKIQNAYKSDTFSPKILKTMYIYYNIALKYVKYLEKVDKTGICVSKPQNSVILFNFMPFLS